MKRPFFILLFIIAFLFSSLKPSFANTDVKKEADLKKDSYTGSVQFIGVMPTFYGENVYQFYKPFIDYLNKTTNIRWELKLYPTYTSTLNAICSKEIDIAYIGPNLLGLAHEKCNAKPLVVSLNSSGKPFYRSVIFTSDSKITTIKGLKGKKVAFGDNASTATNIVPREMLNKEGLFFDMIKPVFYKNHQDIIKAVASNKVSAGSAKEHVLERFKDFNFRALKVSEPIPQYTFCSAPGVSPEAARKFTDALLRLKPLTEKADKKLVNNWHFELRNGFALPPENYMKEIMKLHRTFKKYNP